VAIRIFFSAITVRAEATTPSSGKLGSSSTFATCNAEQFPVGNSETVQKEVWEMNMGLFRSLWIFSNPQPNPQ
jgi:hypothetical protein